MAGRPEPVPGATLNTPVVAASTYVLGSERIYSRNEATEGWESFEAMLGGLEGGEAVAFSSGMAACAAVLGQLPTGAHLVLGDDCYQGVAGIAAGGRRGPSVARRAAAGDRSTLAAEGLRGGSAVAGVAVEPAARRRRPGRDLRGATRAADPGRCRQHVRDATAPAPAGAGGRHRRALGDQADRWALGPAARRGGHHRRRAAAAAAGAPGA